MCECVGKFGKEGAEAWLVLCLHVKRSYSVFLYFFKCQWGRAHVRKCCGGGYFERLGKGGSGWIGRVCVCLRVRVYSVVREGINFGGVKNQDGDLQCCINYGCR